MIEIPLELILEKFFDHTKVVDIPMLKKAKRKIEKAFKDYSCFPEITYNDIIRVTDGEGLKLQVNRDYSDLIVKTSDNVYVSGRSMETTESGGAKTRKKIEKIWQDIDFHGIKPQRDYEID